MRIESSNIRFSSIHEKTKIHKVDEQLQMWGDVPDETQALPSSKDIAEKAKEMSTTGVGLEIDLTRFSASRYESLFSAETSGKTVGEEGSDIAAQDTRLEIMRLIVEKISGEKIHFYKASNEKTASEEQGEETPADTEETEETKEVGWGLSYDYQEVYTESEHTAFSAEGIIKTADGREIVFETDLQMSRERIDVTRLSIREGDAKLMDPLVINFGGNAAALTESKIDFDLNADGKNESISFVRSGSGFLALDKNQDGVVNDGSELFGPTSGNGFAELAAYDEDGNGWIDEADSIYNELSIWTRDADGQDILSSLREMNVGAVYLQSAATPFELKDSQNETDGIVRATGIYLSETGDVRSVQQVDLVA
jgi:hypothetical protein